MKKIIILLTLITVILATAYLFINKKELITVQVGEEQLKVYSIKDIDDNSEYQILISEYENIIKGDLSTKCDEITVNYELIYSPDYYYVEFHGTCNNIIKIEDFTIVENDKLALSEYNIIQPNNTIEFNYITELTTNYEDKVIIEVGTLNTDTNVEEYSIAANPSSLTAVINKNRRFAEDYVPDNLVSITTPSRQSGNLNLIRLEALPHLENMFSDAKEDGVELIINSAYRDYSTQEILFNNYVEQDGYEEAITYSAFPGASEHQSGLVIDVKLLSNPGAALSTSFAETKEGIWLKENSYKYGFILRYPEGSEDITTYQYEPWHFRFVGIDIAYYIYQSNLTLEEFFLLNSN